MANYTLEVQVNTSQYFFMLGDGVAEEFDLANFTFRVAKLNFDERAGFRYFVTGNVNAESRNEAYATFMERILRVTDAMAFFYSQPFSVEFWNILIRINDDPIAYFSGHKLRKSTSMADYSVISKDLLKTIDASLNDGEIYNTFWLYNNVAKIDSVDYDPASHQFGLCQLIESLADENEVPLCDTCNQGGYKRTSRSDMKAMLGKGLYNKLYSGGDILRNRLAHGSLVGGSFLGNNDVEDVILKVSDRIYNKYKLRNKVQLTMQDRIRATNTWYGGARAVSHNNRGLELILGDYYNGTISSATGNLPIGLRNT